MAGVALGDIHLHFAWQAWHLVTSTVTLRGRLGTYGTGLALVACLVLGVTPWRRGVLRGRRGTWRHPPSLCVAGVALGDIHRHFAWQAWHLWHWAGSGGALGFRCDAVAPRRFAWQAWRLATCTLTLRGRRGTYGTGLALVAPLGFRCDAVAPGVLRGRRGTWRHPPSLCVAGVALGGIHRHFAWQAWHLVASTVTLRGRRGTHGIGLALVARLVLGVTPWRRGVLRGRHGTWRHPPSLCVAGVAHPPSLCVAGVRRSSA